MALSDQPSAINPIPTEETARLEIGVPPTNERETESITQARTSQQIPVADSGRVVFMGESSLISWLTNDQVDFKNVHRTIEETEYEATDASTEPPPACRDSLVTIELERGLLDAFCKYFLPLYPIVNKGQLIHKWDQGTVSPLLKQCVLFIGTVHIEASILTEAGFSCRQDALEFFYQNARRLYDQDVDLDRICIVQSMFMLQFRFGPAPGYRDCFWWASGAVSLAQAIGMHRSVRETTLNPTDQRLWKKIWWLLFLRDRQLASGIGKPLMIDERDCDVEELTLEDFVDGESVETARFVISIIRLARIATDVVRGKFSPAALPSCSSREETRVQIHVALQDWLAGIDSSMQYGSKLGRNRFSLLLSLVYHQIILLLHRPSLRDAKQSPDRRDFSTQMAFYAAAKICDLAHDILKYYKVNEFPHYAELIILSAMAFHSVEGASSQPGEKDLARKRNEVYILSLLEFDRVYFAISRYKLFFGGRVGLWRKLAPNNECAINNEVHGI